MDRLTRAVANGIKAARLSLRLLARHADVSHVQLFRIMRGERRATPAIADKVAKALRQYSKSLAKAAARIRQTETRSKR